MFGNVLPITIVKMSHDSNTQQLITKFIEVIRVQKALLSGLYIREKIV